MRIHFSRARVSTCALALGIIATSGCNNYIKRSDEVIEGKEQPAIIVEMRAQFLQAEPGLFSALLTAATSDVLEEVATETLSDLQSLVGKLGFVTRFEKAIGLELRSDIFLGSDVPPMLSGMWVHPNTANLSTHSSLFGRQYFVSTSRIAELVADESDARHAASLSIEYTTVSYFGIVKWPLAIVRIIVIDDDGSIVLDASGEGKGPMGFILPDRSYESLLAATRAAIENLQNMPVERF